MLFRRPIEHRAESRADLEALLLTVVVEQVAELLGIDPERWTRATRRTVMALWPFGRRTTSVEALLAEANAASPTGPAVAATEPPAGATGDGSFG